MGEGRSGEVSFGGAGRVGREHTHTRARAWEGSRLRLTLAQIEVDVLQAARELHQPRPCRRGKGRNGSGVEG